MILRVQRKLNSQLADFAKQLKDNPTPSTLLFIFGIALFYGFVHAAGPGHGKVIIFSYFLVEEPRISRGVVFGYLFSFIHSSSAVLAVWLLNAFFKHAVFGIQAEVNRVMMQISYGLITLLGCYLLFKAIKAIRNSDGGHHHSHNHEVGTGNLITTALALGIIPCPGTMVIVMFASSMGLFWLGTVIALFMALGMGVTISIVGLMTIFLKHGTLKLLDRYENASRKVAYGFSLAGYSLIILIGASLFLSQYYG